MGLVLVAALIGAGTLVKNNQNTQRGATFASVEALFLPDTKSVQLGSEISSTLMIDSKGRPLTGADLKIKYDSEKLLFKELRVLTKDNFPSGVVWVQNSDEVLVSEVDEEKGLISLVGTNLQKDTQFLPTGIVNIVKIDFVAKALGEAKVTLDTSYENVVSGYNVGALDQKLNIEKVSGASYFVNEETAVSPTLQIY